MPRVLHLLSRQLPTGTARQLEMLCRNLNGFDNVICSVDPNNDRRQRLPDFESPVMYCQLRSPFDVTFLPRFRRELRNWRPDLIHLWGDDARSLPWLVSLLDSGIPVVLSKRSFGASPRSAWCDRWLQKHVSKIVVNHSEIATSIQNQGASACRLQTILNGVDCDIAPTTLSSIHQELEVSSDVRFVAVCGDLVEKKRIKDLIWAMDLLRVIRPEMQLLVIGDGDQRDELRYFDAEVNLSPCVHFLGERSDVANLLRQCTCLWQASRDEGCSNAVLEAMAVGIPVIASDVPGHQLMVAHDQTGFLVRTGDCAEFARKTNILLQSPELGQRICQAAQRTVTRSHAVADMSAQYHSLYTTILATSPRQAA